VQVLVIFFVCNIDMHIRLSDTFSCIFWQYLIPILLPSGALVKSVNNNITVTERTVILHLK